MSAVLETAGGFAYLLAALLAALPFGPAEATAMAGGLLTTGAALDFWVMVAVLSVGVLLGDCAVFTTVRRVKPRLLGRWLPTVEGADDRASRSSARGDRLQRGSGWVDIAVLGGRFVPGARTPTTALAAASSLSTRRYIGLSAVSAGTWALAGVTAGRVFGELGVPLGLLVLGEVLTFTVIAAVLNADARRRRSRAAVADADTVPTPSRKDTTWTPS